MALSPIPEILDDLRAGKVIVLVDDERRENEGDFVCAAEKVTPEIINFLTKHTPGYLCIAMTGEDCDRLDLQPQVAVNTSLRHTAMAVSIDGHPRHGVGTGISASDRAKTVRIAVDPKSKPDDLVRPGHMVPLRARSGGVLVRTGQTEGSVDLARLAGLRPAAVISEVCRDDGEMARMPELESICTQHNLKMCSVEQIIQYRLERETLIERLPPVEGTKIRTPWGEFNLIAYQSAIDPLPHLALAVGLQCKAADGIGRQLPLPGREGAGGRVGREISVDAPPSPRPGESPLETHQSPSKAEGVRPESPVLVRVHRRDLLGDIFEESTNPTGQTLRASMRMIEKEGRGVLVYVRPEGIGDDLRGRLQKIRRPPEMDRVNSPDLTRADSIAGRAMPLDQREIGIGGQILRDLGITRIRLLTNHPRNYPGLHGFGLEIVEQVAIEG